MPEDEFVEKSLLASFEAGLMESIKRCQSTKVHPLIPIGFFAGASSECRDLFVSGKFYGCVTLAQSVAEGLAKFLAAKNGLPVRNTFRANVGSLLRAKTISPSAREAFVRIHDKDRNDFHHLNSNVEQDYRKLESRAKECVLSLFEIESEVFAFDYAQQGKIRLRHPQYWTIGDQKDVQVFIRADS